jgi:hypothetical protein
VCTAAEGALFVAKERSSRGRRVSGYRARAHHVSGPTRAMTVQVPTAPLTCGTTARRTPRSSVIASLTSNPPGSGRRLRFAPGRPSTLVTRSRCGPFQADHPPTSSGGGCIPRDSSCTSPIRSSALIGPESLLLWPPRDDGPSPMARPLIGSTSARLAACETSHGVRTSSDVLVEGGPGGVFVVESVALQAAVEDADEAVGELAQGGVVVLAAGGELVVVGAGGW